VSLLAGPASQSCLSLPNLILWIHVICGAGWIGACLIFVLASTALGGQPAELREFVDRVAPRTNRIGIVCAVLIPVTGLANFAYAARKRDYQLPAEFDGILITKLLLLGAMVLMLMRASRLIGSRTQEPQNESRPLVVAYGVIAGCGAFALVLGLWLSGL